MKEIESLSIKIKEKMKVLKLTQLDLVEHCGLSIKTIRAIINGNEGTAIGNWIIVANILGLEFELNIKKLNDETRNRV